jgi:hypothetical protein
MAAPWLGNERVTRCEQEAFGKEQGKKKPKRIFVGPFLAHFCVIGVDSGHNKNRSILSILK